MKNIGEDITTLLEKQVMGDKNFDVNGINEAIEILNDIIETLKYVRKELKKNDK